MFARYIAAVVAFVSISSPAVAQPAWIEPLGPREGATPYSYAHGVAADGSTALGEAYCDDGFSRGYFSVAWKDDVRTKLYKWTRSAATDISANADIYVGYNANPPSAWSQAWVKRPSDGAGVHVLHDHLHRGHAAACSDDAGVIVGGLVKDETFQGNPYFAVRWKANGTSYVVSSLPKVESYSSFAYGCTADGAGVCGSSGWDGGTFAFAWREGDSLLTNIGSLDTESAYGVAYHCSPDQPIWVGASATDGGRIHAFLSYYGTLYDLDTIDGAVGDSFAFGCSDDGFVAVGTVVLPGGIPPRACVWVDRTGYDLKKLLEAYDVDLTGWSELNSVTKCAAGGRIVVGAGLYEGNTTGFIAKLPPFEEKPVARAGRDQTVQARTSRGARVRIDGRTSYDPDGGPLTYLWTARNIVFKNAAAGTTSAMFPVGKTKVKLQVTDETGRKDTDILYVTVRLANSSVRERGSYADEVFAIAAEEAYRAAGANEIDSAAIAACEYATAASLSGGLVGDVIEWEEGESLDDVYLDYALSRNSQMLLGLAAAHSLGESLARTGDPATQQALFHTIQGVRHAAADLRTPVSE